MKPVKRKTAEKNEPLPLFPDDSGPPSLPAAQAPARTEAAERRYEKPKDRSKFRRVWDRAQYWVSGYACVIVGVLTLQAVGGQLGFNELVVNIPAIGLHFSVYKVLEELVTGVAALHLIFIGMKGHTNREGPGGRAE